MELRDLIVTPILVIIIYFIAYLVRPYVVDNVIRQYFFPALTLKIFGAISLGLIYTFYYSGGDTFKYHTYGSRRIWELFLDSPFDAIDLFLLLNKETFNKFIFAFPIIQDDSSFFVARISFIFDLFTFSTYSATAVFFAVFSFMGMWLLFKTFYNRYPTLHRFIAFAILFIPSIIFWGSGVLKDTITIGCIGIATYYISRLFIEKFFAIHHLVLLVASLYVIFAVKKYILFCFIPAALIWVFFSNLASVKSVMVRILLMPIVLTLSMVFGYYAVVMVGEGDKKYSIDKLAETAKVTAYDIRYQTGRDAGSGYELGELDGTMRGLVRLLPQAINVSLFRPYLWEVNNPLMLLSAIESVGLLLLTLYVLYISRKNLFKIIAQPDILFCLVFSISFAFAVGASTYNFGTLVRYKIPLLPFYVLAMVLLIYYSNRERKFTELEDIE